MEMTSMDTENGGVFENNSRKEGAVSTKQSDQDNIPNGKTKPRKETQQATERGDRREGSRPQTSIGYIKQFFSLAINKA